MKVLKARLPKKVEKKLRMKSGLKHRTLSMQVSRYIHDAIFCEENADLPYAFIKETIKAKSKINAGFGREYPFGILKT
jgi:hypothetical protein